MFTVPRYDPKKPASQLKSDKKRKRLRASTDKEQNQRTHQRRNDSSRPEEAIRPGGLRVIAREEQSDKGTSITTSRHETSLPYTKASANEALDDFDLLIDPSERPDKGMDSAADDTKHSVGINPKDRPEVKAALHVTTLPMDEVAQAWELAPFLRDNLRRDGFASFFPIQALVIPEVIMYERHPYLRAQDICITAPTGSGKSLAYILPILNALAHRQIRRLAALVVLPSRDLALQVYSVFRNYVKGSDLKVGLAIGQSDFQAEQRLLTIDPESSETLQARQTLSFDPGNLDMARVMRLDNTDHCEYAFSTTETTKCSTAIDILVCTPGRLVDHLDNTRGFQLQHLRFLVVDEADRLLSQSYQNWIDRVIEDANAGSVNAWRAMEKGSSRAPKFATSLDETSYQIDPITWRRGGSVGDNSDFNTNASYLNMAASVCRPVQLRKFLVSATMTKDPQKLATLKLVNPKHFDVHQLGAIGSEALNKFTMAEGLSEYSIECKVEQKPIVLLALLLELLQKKEEKWTAVVFTSSLESTHRLTRLLQLLWMKGQYGASDAVAEFSSALSQSERTALLSRCRNPNDSLSIMVCSDGMSRGMDLENIHAVINYDVPSLAKTYIHRCGRTARAGRSGIAITILKGGQVTDFRRMRNLIQSPESVQTWNVKKTLVENAVPIYRECLGALRDILEEEEHGHLAPTHRLYASVFEDGDVSGADNDSY